MPKNASSLLILAAFAISATLSGFSAAANA